MPTNAALYRETRDPFGKLFEPLTIADLHLDITTALVPYIRFSDPNEPELLFMPAFHKLRAPRKLLVVLLAAAVLDSLGHTSFGSVTPHDLECLTGLKGNTVRPCLRRLLAAGLISHTEHASYSIETTDQARAVCRTLLRQALETETQS